MKIHTIILVSVILFMAACQSNRLTYSEKKIINAAPADSAMYVLSVFNQPDSLFLRKSAMEVLHPGNKHIEKLTQRMLATVMHPDSRGVGIAAPQVGVSRNIIWVQRFDKENEPFEVYFNPVILSKSAETVTRDEGCLSIPDCRGPVERTNLIQISYVNQTGAQMTETVEGFTARIFQHEIDHLNGVLYIDRIKVDSLLKRF